MPKAKKLPSGNYRTRVHVGNGKYKSFTAETKKESEYLASQFLMRSKKSNADRLYVSDLIYDYIKLKEEQFSPSTIRAYWTAYRTQKDSLKIMVREFSNLKHQQWIDALSKKYAPKTVKNYNALLVATFNHYNIPLDKVTLPKLKYVQLKIPTTTQIADIVKYFDDIGDFEMVKAVYLSSVGTLRRGEISALQGEDVNRHDNTIFVHRSMAVSEGGEDVLKEPKTYSSNRVIELPKFIIDMLPDDRVVNLRPNQISMRFNRAMKKLGMDFNFHSLRHYSASIMHSQNIPTQYIMEKGGWKSESTLNRIYRNTLDDYTKKFNLKTNEFFEENFVSYSCHKPIKK